MALVLTPREENPQIIVPSAQVTVTMPGASSLEVEKLIVTPLEGILSEIEGVDHTYGVAMNSAGIVTVQFEAGQNKEDSLVKVYDRLLVNRHRLPAQASEPLIRSLDVDDIAVVAVTLTSSSYNDYALKRLADRMGERLRSLKSVSVVSVKGGRDCEVRIELNPERLQAFGVPLNRVQSTLAANNVAAPVGDTVREGTYETVFLKGFFRRAEDLRKLVVGQHKGRPVYLGDIANIIDGPPVERERLSRFSFGAADPRFTKLGAKEMPAVTLGVAKKKGTNAVFMANDTIERIERMRREFVHKNVHVIITRNDGQKANDAVNVLIEHLGIAISTVFLVLILFLGWKEALIVTLAVPLVFFITIGADLLGGVSINRVSLFALILSLGLLVDDAIVVIENIHRRYKSDTNGDRRRTTVRACAEVSGAANLATLTVMAVFASLFLVTGMPGQYFQPVAFNVPIAMAASLLVAYTVTPWASLRWLGNGHGAEKPHKKSKEFLARLYRQIIVMAIKRTVMRWIIYGLTLALLVLTLLQPAWQFIRPEGVTGPKPFFGVALGFLPKGNKNTFNVTIEMAESTPVETTDRMVRELNAVLAKNVLVMNTQSWIGQSGVVDFNGLLRGSNDKIGPHIAEIRVNLVNKHHRATSSIELVRSLREELKTISARYPGSVVQLVEDPPGPPVRATVLAEIYGNNLETLRALSGKVKSAFGKTYGMVDINDSEIMDVREHQIIVDKEKAALSGVSVARIAQILSVMFDDAVIGRVHPNGKKNAIPVRVLVPHKDRLNPEQLDRVLVESDTGKRVPLSELVRVVPGYKDRPILHKDNERVTFVGGELSQSAPVYAIIDLDKRLDALAIGNGETLTTTNLTFASVAPDTINGYQLLWGGEIRLTLDTFRDMGLALGLALMAVFLLLVSYYRSFSIPMIAMSPIPLGMIGVFPGHWIMGVNFSATSMVGIIALAGVAIRSALLIIDFVRDNRKAGMSLHRAVH